MNKTFCSIWNQSLGAWVAAPETARTRGRTSGSGGAGPQIGSEARNVSKKRGVVLAMAAVCGMFGALPAAHAACSNFTAGAAVLCTGTITGVNSPVNNMTVNIASGALILAPIIQFSSVKLTGNNTTLNNNGTIDPSGVAPVPGPLTSGVTLGNAFNSIVNIDNKGIIRGTVDMVGPIRGSLAGTALEILNGGGGTTTIANSGTLATSPLAGITAFAADAPVVGVSGGSQVIMTNTGTITGRVAFQASTRGNIFINAGTIAGSVSLGSGAAMAPNRFDAVIGSVVSKSMGTATETLVAGETLVFASTGVVDGGTGGNSTLTLQNAIGGGAGSAGSDFISGDTYRNFNNLVVNSGTWTLSGSTIAGLTSTTVAGGTLKLSNTSAGNVTVNVGGNLSGAGTIAQDLTVNAGGSLTGSQGQTLTIGNLTLNSGSHLNTVLGGASTQALFHVTGDLALNGATLNVSDQGGFGAGVYRLFNYDGTFTNLNGGLISGTTPTGAAPSRLTVQHLTGAKQINLVSTAGIDLAYWDGTALSPDGTIQGGSGVWNAANSNWTSADGMTNASYLPTQATFQGTAGTVIVDNTFGSIGVTGMTFKSDGYRIAGDPITLQGAGGQTFINVGNNTPAGSDTTATIDASLTGASKLIKSDYGTLVLTGANTYTGGTDVQFGTLSVSSDANLGAASGALTMKGGTLATMGNFTSARNVTMTTDAKFDVATGTQLGLAGVLSGGGDLYKLGAGTLTLTGANTYGGTTRVQAGTLIGDSTSIRGNLVNNGSVIFNQNVDGALSGLLLGTGAATKRGTGSLTLNGVNTLNWNIEQGSIISNASLYTANATIGADARLRFDQAADADYAGKFSGSGTFEKAGAGVLSLNADNSAFTGNTAITNGTLVVTNKLGGNVNVQSGRLHVTGTVGGNVTVGAGNILSGTGTLSQNATLTGAELRGTQGRTLKIGGNLTLDSASRVNVSLDRAGSTALFDVGGDLGLAGTLNVTDLGAFGAGVYRLFDYRGALATNALTIGATPSGVTANDLRIQTATAGQINLVSTKGANLMFWDGSNAAQRDNGVIDGGTGAWRTDGLNWTDVNGTINGRFQADPAFAVFQGTAGAVTVDTSAGPISTTGMQFLSDGYRIQGDPITLASTNGEAFFRVGTNSPTSANTTATLFSNLLGTNKLVKVEAGTLVLAGGNSYTGGTEIRGGAVSVSADDNLGAPLTAVTLNGGSLLSTASFTTSRNIALAQTGAIEVAAGTTLGVQGAITGSGNLQKLGSGTLTLTGANTYGNTQVLAGTLVGDVASIRGDLANDGTVVFNQASDASYYGYITGTGSMVKQGAGNLTLSGLSSQAWRLDAGTFTTEASRHTGDTSIAAGATLRFSQTTGTSYSGALSGAGQLIKAGTGTLTLMGDNSAFTGNTDIQAGTFWLVSNLPGSVTATGGLLYLDSVLGGNATISNGAALFGTGRIAGDVTLTAGTLIGEQGSKLSIDGNLTLDNVSQVNVMLGRAPATASALFNVGGNLTLAGTLNVEDIGGFGAGVYRLFDYNGNLINNGLTVGATPSGVAASALTVQTAVGGQVNLASTSGATLSFWDGGNTARHDNGTIDGGSGTWRTDGRNWANANGTLNGVFQPNPTFAIFQGTAGTVTVDASAGAIGITGLQIATDGYRIEGDDIALQGAGGESIIRVGSGSVADASMTGTIASRLTGASKLAKTDYGTLVLTGDNTYTGGTDVRVGTLAVAKDANLGAAAGGLALSGGTLATTASFDTARSVVLSGSSGIAVAPGTAFGLTGAITGNGDLAKLGAGTLTVSGDGSGYAGSTLVQAGTLNLAPTGKLGGVLTVANGAVLQGVGQVGTTTLQSGAILAPGNLTGALKVAGDLTFMPGSVYQVAADPVSSASARVNVSGVANLAGSVVHVGPEGGFEASRQYTILSANTIRGQFDNVLSNYAYLNPGLSYGAQEVTLQLGRKQVPVDPVNPGTRPIAFEDAAQTGNQRAVARALDSLPADSALHQYILTLPNGAPPAAFNSLSGEAHASVASNLMASSATPRTVPLSHLRTNLAAGMRAGAPTAQAGGMLSASALPSSNAQPAWAELVGNWQTQKATDNTAQVRQHTGGVFVGADHAVGNGWRAGGALGYTDSKVRVDDLASQADVSGYSAAIYGGKSFEAGAGKLNLLVGTSYTWHDVSSKRYASVAGTSQKLTADYGASTTQLFTELGYALPLADRATIEPFAGLAWSDLRTRSFSESGGSAALRGQSSSDKQTSTTLGVRAQTAFTLAGAEGVLQGTLGWRHAFGDLAPQTSMAFDGGQAFTVSGAPIARNAALAELGAEVAVSRNASLGLNYSGQYGGGNREHAGSLNVRWRY